MGGEVNAMLMDWEDLTRKECALSGISAIYQTPAYRKLRNDSRKINGFLLIEKGECHYLWQDGSAWLFPGSVIYLPKGSRHTMTVTTPEIAFTRVDFTVTVGGQEAFFSRGPMVLTPHASPACAEAFHRLTDEYFGMASPIREKKLLCDIMLAILDGESRDSRHRIAPALDYIRAHYREKIDIPALSALCFLSPAQMYRLFEKETGLAPLAYREQLRVRHACLLLREPECSVTEIASQLGYESLYYFSRVFRRKTGLSPSEYRKLESAHQTAQES